MTKYILAGFLLLSLGGCGSSQDNKKKVKIPSNVIQMQIGQDYKAYKGDTLKKTTAETKVKIVKATEEDFSTVTIIEGSATLTRK